ncbi:unnamed protein product [Linum tenue]|uniref:Uncharacterized protein n=1 Tax=Linum tenue TaxID=586396 RepID=A0AAV0IP44_9ROSI|nr:unnamed protein product [Linum tenue]
MFQTCQSGALFSLCGSAPRKLGLARSPTGGHCPEIQRAAHSSMGSCGFPYF